MSLDFMSADFLSLIDLLQVGFAARYDTITFRTILLTNSEYRTKISDPSFTNDTNRMNEISTKLFGKVVSRNITDVRRLLLG